MLLPGVPVGYCTISVTVWLSVNVPPVTLVPGSGSSSTFSMTFNRNSLPQGTDQITVQYQGNAPDDPSTAVVTISNPLADFSLIAYTAIIPVAANSSASTTINLASVNTFAGAVNLTCAVPTGWTCAISASEMLASAGSAAATLIVTAPSNASLGSNSVLITGQDSTGEYVHTLGLIAQVVPVTVNVPPSFALSNSGSITLTAGATTGNTSTVSVTPSTGFMGTVNLTCSVMAPTGASSAVTCTVPSSVDVTGATAVTATLTAASTSSTTAGAYVITVTGTSAGITQTATVNVTVSAPQASYALTNGANISVSPGATTGNTSTITVTPSNGFTGTVVLACAFTTNASTDPATCSLSPASVDITSGALPSTLTINTTAATSAKNEVKKLFWPSTGGVALASLLFFLTPRRRRNWLAFLGLLVVSAGLAGMGCGGSNRGGGSGNGGGGGGSGNTATTAGAYTVTVTGTSGSASQATTITLTVN
jgi:trimeric autotransporter adhesin